MRAQEISQKLPTGLIDEDIKAGSAFARFGLSADDKALRNALAVALEARRAKQLPASPVSAYGWLLLARFEGIRKDHDNAQKFADRGLADAEEMGEPVDPVLMRSALVNAAVFRVVPFDRDEQAVTEAVRYLERSFGLFPPQVSIDTFDPLLAQAVVWRIAVNALASTEEPPGATTGSRVIKGEDLHRGIDEGKSVGADKWVRWRDRPAGCAAIEFERGEIPKNPRATLRKGQLGAALIGHDMSGVTVSRAIILAESHNSGFGEAIVSSMKDWRAKTPPAPGCEKNHLYRVRVYFSYR